MKELTEMSSRELFCLLAGDQDVLLRARLQDMILRYREKHPERQGQSGEMDLREVVAEMSADSRNS